MDAESLLSRMRQELAPLYAELVRIRALLERIERAGSASSAGSFVETPVEIRVAAADPPVEPPPKDAALDNP